MTYAVLTYPRDALLLRRKARPVSDHEFGTPALLEFAQRLGDTMMSCRAYGLAATQVAEHPGGEAWSMFALRAREDSFGIVINPEILVAEEPKIGPEACLSFASVGEPLHSPEEVQVRGRSPRGEVFTLVLSGIQARAVWHEERHLRGLLMIDAMGALKRALFLKRVMKVRRGGGDPLRGR